MVEVVRIAFADVQRVLAVDAKGTGPFEMMGLRV